MEFPHLYKEQFAYVWRTLRRLGVRDRDLPDVTHDFFVIVFRQLAQYDESRPIKPWLSGIAFRVVSDYRRSARFQREVLEEPPEQGDSGPAADDRVAMTQARTLMTNVLNGLELERRAVFVMHDLDGQSMPHVASALEIPLATAYSRLRLAREDITAAVKRLRAKADGAEGRRS